MELDRKVEAKQSTSADRFWALLQQRWHDLLNKHLEPVFYRIVCSSGITAKGCCTDESKICFFERGRLSVDLTFCLV